MGLDLLDLLLRRLILAVVCLRVLSVVISPVQLRCCAFVLVASGLLGETFGVTSGFEIADAILKGALG